MNLGSHIVYFGKYLLLLIHRINLCLFPYWKCKNLIFIETYVALFFLSNWFHFFLLDLLDVKEREYAEKNIFHELKTCFFFWSSSAKIHKSSISCQKEEEWIDQSKYYFFYEQMYTNYKSKNDKVLYDEIYFFIPILYLAVFLYSPKFFHT